MVVENIKINKSPGTDHNHAELIKMGCRTTRPEIHKLSNSIWNKEEWSEEWKGSIILHIYTMGDTTDCSNFRGTTTYTILSNIQL